MAKKAKLSPFSLNLDVRDPFEKAILEALHLGGYGFGKRVLLHLIEQACGYRVEGEVLLEDMREIWEEAGDIHPTLKACARAYATRPTPDMAPPRPRAPREFVGRPPTAPVAEERADDGEKSVEEVLEQVVEKMTPKLTPRAAKAVAKAAAKAAARAAAKASPAPKAPAPPKAPKPPPVARVMPDPEMEVVEEVELEIAPIPLAPPPAAKMPKVPKRRGRPPKVQTVMEVAAPELKPQTLVQMPPQEFTPAAPPPNSLDWS